MKAICASVVKLALAALLTYVIIVYVLGLFPPVSVTKLLGS
jgi:hypothetical protein